LAILEPSYRESKPNFNNEKAEGTYSLKCSIRYSAKGNGAFCRDFFHD
jgi:hypothetical protein